MNTPIKIFVVDDEPLFLKGLELIFQTDTEIELVESYAPGESYYGLPKQEQEKKIRKDIFPHIHDMDVLLLDIRLRGLEMNGFDLATEIADQHPNAKIIILSSHDDGYYGHQALNILQLPGYLIKGSEAGELKKAIKTVSRGQSYYSPSVIDQTRKYARQNKPIKFTPRQQEVLTLLVDELTANEIGDRLHISPTTVRDYIEQLKRILKVRRTTGIIREACIRKLVDVSKYSTG